MPSLSPTTILISGANRGLGKGLLEIYLGKPNHTVIAANRDPSSPSSLALLDLSKGTGSKLILVKVDTSIESDADKAITSLISQYKITSLDLVIANAGIRTSFCKIREVKVVDIQKHIETNLYGVIALFQAAGELLLNSENPIWVTMGSGAAFIGNMTPMPSAAYSPSKIAVHWVTKKINEEGGICAFVITPGWVQTDMGDFLAQSLGAEKAPGSFEDSVRGTVDIIEKATKESHGGKLWSSLRGTNDPW